MKSLVKYCSQDTAGTIQAGFKEAFPLPQKAQEFSTPGLGCILGQEAGPHSEWTIVDVAMRKGLKMRCVYNSEVMKKHTSASSDHKLIIFKESWLLGGAAVWVHNFPVTRFHCPL